MTFGTSRPGGALQRSGDGGRTWSYVAFFTGQAQQLRACGDRSVWVLNADGSAELIPAWQRIMQPSGMTGSLDMNGSQVVAGQDTDGMRWLVLGNSLNNGWFRDSPACLMSPQTDDKMLPGALWNSKCVIPACGQHRWRAPPRRMGK